MNRTIFALIMMVLIASTSSYAQNIRFGLKGGLNFASISTNIGSTDGTTGFHAGTYLTIKISKFAIQPEALFSIQGADGSELRYVNIPIMAKFYLISGLHIEAGPQFGILVDGEEINTIDAAGNIIALDAKDAYKTSDLGLAIGAGFDLPFGLGIGARYVIGLNDINEQITFGPSIPDIPEFKNNVFMVSVWYALKK